MGGKRGGGTKRGAGGNRRRARRRKGKVAPTHLRFFPRPQTSSGRLGFRSPRLVAAAVLETLAAIAGRRRRVLHALRASDALPSPRHRPRSSPKLRSKGPWPGRKALHGSRHHAGWSRRRPVPLSFARSVCRFFRTEALVALKYVRRRSRPHTSASRPLVRFATCLPKLPSHLYPFLSAAQPLQAPRGWAGKRCERAKNDRGALERASRRMPALYAPPAWPAPRRVENLLGMRCSAPPVGASGVAFAAPRSLALYGGRGRKRLVFFSPFARTLRGRIGGNSGHFGES